MAARAVGSFADQKVFAEVDLCARKIKLPEDLVVDQLEQMAFGGQEWAIAGIVS